MFLIDMVLHHFPVSPSSLQTLLETSSFKFGVYTYILFFFVIIVIYIDMYVTCTNI